MFTLHIQKRTLAAPSLWRACLSPCIAIVATLVFTSMLLAILDFDVVDTLLQFFVSPLLNLYELVEVIMKASILALIAFGLLIGFRANVWNIGAEGQLLMGAIAGSIVALFFHEQQGWYILPLMLICGCIGGILWALIPALLKNYFHTNEILTSLMLVYVAELLLSYLVHGPMRDPMGLNFPQSVYFSDAAILPYLLSGTRLSVTPFVVLLLLPMMLLLLQKSYLGYQLSVSGESQRAANYAGFSTKRLVLFSFLVSGALAGLAGITEVSANLSQLVPNISPGYGFTAIIVAFLGRLNPIGVIFAALVMAVIYIGSESAQITMGLPVSMASVFQGLMLFCLLSADFLQHYRIRVLRQ